MFQATQLYPHCKATGKRKLHSRQGVFYFRQKVPQDLLHCFGGLKEIKKSLKTRHPAQAKLTFSVWSGKTDKLFVD